MPQTDTPTDTVPAATLRAWQKRAHQQLAEFLARAERADLPPLRWTISVNGNLIGEADGLNYPAPAEQREVIRRWASLLDMKVDTEHTTDGREELYAGWKNAKNGTHGCFRATIFLHREDA
ncbi:hypothetical protein ABZW38_16735 [Streptomyces bacillaris]|uniref:hypothetical protein n=1 Tax=Streptomyces bacillaris TaxID=68179 RepID=UPI00345FC5C8